MDWLKKHWHVPLVWLSIGISYLVIWTIDALKLAKVAITWVLDHIGHFRS